ncbi:MAG: RNA polymerase sigma factor [Acidobacteriia bacterium]|nr:RNA polymerase sigma factor [Terriglobia bacterium]
MEKAGYLEEDANELIAQARSGNHAAFEMIYRMHLSRVYAICLRILADRARAEETTQQIFVRAWIKLNSFRGESSFASWLYRLSVNVILGELKSSGRRGERFAAGEDSQPASAHGAEPARNLRMDLERAIASLPRQARAVFVLHDIEGFKHGEIAEAMGLATGTCKAQLSRARKLLREALER